jgi:hypothetical protein
MIIIYLPDSLTHIDTRDVNINSFLELEYPTKEKSQLRIRISNKSNEYLSLISWLSVPDDLGNIKINIEYLSMFLHDCKIFNFNETSDYVEFIFSVKWFC